MRNRRAEQRHHCVADELLHRAAETLELRAQTLVVGTEDRLDVLRIELLGACREADEVGEEDGDDLPFAPRRSHEPSLGRLADPLHSIPPTAQHLEHLVAVLAVACDERQLDFCRCDREIHALPVMLDRDDVDTRTAQQRQ